MSKAHILIVDDEEEIRELIGYNLRKEGYRVGGVESGEQALEEIKLKPFDLVVLDLMLPGVDGLDVCKLLKASPDTAGIPILMLSAKGEESDVVTGLELGADDYVVKPFSPRVLLARIKAVLRRRKEKTAEETDVIRAGDLMINPGARNVTVQGKSVTLSNTEFRILHHLARRPGWVFTRYQIVDSTQTDNTPVTSRTVDVHVVALRRKLGVCASHIETIRGVGYRFRESVDES